MKKPTRILGFSPAEAVAIALGAVLIVIPEPATTATGLVLVTSAIGARVALRGQ
jgi:hypothetical protein